MTKRDALGELLMVRVCIIVAMALGVGTLHTQASCLEDFQSHMEGIYHHGPYQIDGKMRSDRGEGHSEVKFIYPDRISFKVYDDSGDIKFGSIDIDARAWRLDTNGHWIVFSGEDSYSLKNVIARGSGDFKKATHVACPDPVPNNVDGNVNYQYQRPFSNEHGSYQAFITFDKISKLPVRSDFSWSTLVHSGEDVYKYRFDPYIHIESPISDPAP